jgi:hypothetical protein
MFAKTPTRKPLYSILNDKKSSRGTQKGRKREVSDRKMQERGGMEKLRVGLN